MRLHLVCLGASLALLLHAASSQAGMASPLPTEQALRRVPRLNEPIQARLQALSFFLAILLGCALAVKGLWKWLARDFPRMPRLPGGRGRRSFRRDGQLGYRSVPLTTRRFA